MQKVNTNNDVHGLSNAASPRSPNRRRCARSGTAILETLMSIPFLVTIISMIFFFGWVNRNNQKVKIASRYASWNRVNEGSWESNERLNDIFLSPGAEIVKRRHSRGPEDTLYDLTAEAGRDYSPSQELSRRTVNEKYPRGRGVKLTVDFAPPQSYWRHFITDSLKSHHLRDGRQWRRREAKCWKELSEVFYGELDEVLNSVPYPGEDMGRTFRKLYLVDW